MNLEPMWEKLAEYQQYAEQKGFGEAWLKMTTERTVEAANAAATSASASAAAAEAAAAWLVSDAAECAAECAADAAESEADAARVAWEAECAICYITSAIEQEGKE